MNWELYNPYKGADEMLLHIDVLLNLINEFDGILKPF
jgi:hypothetical protein